MNSDQRNKLITLIKRDIRSIGAIYRTVGQALYDEPVQRLAERIVTTFEQDFNPKDKPHDDQSEKNRKQPLRGRNRKR